MSLIKSMAALVFIAGLTGLSGPSFAVSPDVEAACADDYFKFCSQHDPKGKGVRSCMKSHQRSLSRACVTALVNSGEAGAPKKAVARRSKS